MQFLRQLFAKMELTCQQPAMSQLSGVQEIANQPGVQDRMAGAHGVVWL